MNEHAPPHEDPPLGRLGADRPCIRCGHNLVNQSIRREPHYGLLIVRCPECGTAASMEEYPVLGAWARRLGALLAALVLVALLGAIAATSGITSAMSFALNTEATRSFARHLESMHAAAAHDEGATAIVWQGDAAPKDGPTLVFDDWASRHDGSALLGDWLENPDRASLSFFVPFLAGMLVVEVAIGVVWTALLAGTPRGRLAWRALPILVISALFCSFEYLSWFGRGISSPHYIAESILGVRLLPALLVALVGACAIGMAFGRPIVRWLVRMLLAPRLRGALASLWTVDGLPPPR